jgi:hypothetical protein
MTRKEWILANLEGEVQKRALRACEEQETLNSSVAVKALLSLFVWIETKEGHKYWQAIFENEPNPDQYLPEGYVDVDYK